MTSFSLRIKKGQDFTPASLMLKYAKAGDIRTEYRYDQLKLIINGVRYGYDHYKVDDNLDGSETVTVYLK